MTHGRHIKIVGYANPEKLGSAEIVSGFLEAAVEALGMRALGETHIYNVEADIKKMGIEPFEDEGGVTGLIVLSTSHISIHTWPLREFFVADVYSCRDFATSTATETFEKFFGKMNVRITDISDSLIPPSR